MRITCEKPTNILKTAIKNSKNINGQLKRNLWKSKNEMKLKQYESERNLTLFKELKNMGKKNGADTTFQK